MLLTSEEQKKIAVLVNSRINIPLVPESMEEALFIQAVGLVDKALGDMLPDIFAVLLRNEQKGIKKEHAEEFGRRLVAALNKKIDIPYFGEDMEKQFLEYVVAPLIEAMTDEQNIDKVVARIKARVDPMATE